ncbi:MAG: GNAT family N-acetyltransferase [Ignavibacteriaceae bacterium]
MSENYFKEVTIKKIEVDSAGELTELLQSEPPEYSAYFTPFDFNYDTIENILLKKEKDIFFGLFIDNKIAGFYMLRGFDEGYEIPVYGVWISSKFSGKGLGKLTLQHAVSFCKINGIKKIMLKVYPKNTAAKTLYENFGFKNIGTDPKNNNFIYMLNLE